MSQTFDPYGNPYSSTGAGQSTFGFAGEQTDNNGLVFLRARYYNPAQGGFGQRDTFRGSIMSPASLNPYAYAHGNPVMFTDPSGLCIALTDFDVSPEGSLVGKCIGNLIDYAKVALNPLSRSEEKDRAFHLYINPLGVEARQFANEGNETFATWNRYVGGGRLGSSQFGQWLGYRDTSAYYAGNPDAYYRDRWSNFGLVMELWGYACLAIGPANAAKTRSWDLPPNYLSNRAGNAWHRFIWGNDPTFMMGTKPIKTSRGFDYHRIDAGGYRFNNVIELDRLQDATDILAAADDAPGYYLLNGTERMAFRDTVRGIISGTIFKERSATLIGQIRTVGRWRFLYQIPDAEAAMTSEIHRVFEKNVAESIIAALDDVRVRP
jgi:RHS repeat-associated protein